MSEAELNDANDVLYKSEESWSKLEQELKEVMKEGGVGSKKLVNKINETSLETLKPTHFDLQSQILSSCEDNIAFLKMLLDSINTNSSNASRKTLRNGKGKKLIF